MENFPSVLVVSPAFAKSNKGMNILKAKYEVATAADVASFTGDCDNVKAIVLGDQPLGGGVMDLYTNLKTIARNGTGCDNIDLIEANKRNIVVTRVSSASVDLPTECVSEYALGLILSLTRNIIFSHDVLSYQNRWSEGRVRGRMLSELTVGIVGLGAVGHSLAEKLHVLGVKNFFGYNRTLRNRVLAAADRYGMKLTSIADIMRKSDVVVLCLALTPETRGIISREMLFLMHPKALLVNIARGSLVDEDALAEMVENDKIGGVALDVYSEEPPFNRPFFRKMQNALLHHRNVIMTPHGAPLAEAALEEVSEKVAHNVISVLEGKSEEAEIVA